MGCSEKRELITLYASGELPESEGDGLEAHLRECPSCREELSLARSLEDGLKREKVVPAPPAFSERVMRAVEELERRDLAEKVARTVMATRGPDPRRDIAACIFLALIAGILSSLWISRAPALLVEIESAAGALGVRDLLASMASLDTETFLAHMNTLLAAFSIALGIAAALGETLRLRDGLLSLFLE